MPLDTEPFKQSSDFEGALPLLVWSLARPNDALKDLFNRLHCLSASPILLCS
ncbi:hypothetical protein KL86PLE_40232 [uncultured Pleomorphomonas sp.]|uniref:Uncharacterized protein n=1 Tax=uncultured Pleomorphomonas sp. TaxID=442121 RepID=A0A212LG33_9HYPH|nr:hypothetical protein KL86PLE_40232 [uncultured Pleomorphomonas sp.]